MNVCQYIYWQPEICLKVVHGCRVLLKCMRTGYEGVVILQYDFLYQLHDFRALKVSFMLYIGQYVTNHLQR